MVNDAEGEQQNQVDQEQCGRVYFYLLMWYQNMLCRIQQKMCISPHDGVAASSAERAEHARNGYHLACHSAVRDTCQDTDWILLGEFVGCPEV